MFLTEKNWDALILQLTDHCSGPGSATGQVPLSVCPDDKL